MRLKFYLRGAGIGILVATILLAVSFSLHRNYTMSDEDVIKRARELGMVMKEEIPEMAADIAENTSDDNLDADQKADTNIIEENPDIAVENQDNNIVDVPEEEAEGEAENEDGITTEITYRAFTVNAGDSSNSVAENLKRAGFIEDAEDFNDYMNRLNVDNIIKTGTFYIPSNAEYEDLIALLVSKDDRLTSPPAAPAVPVN